MKLSNAGGCTQFQVFKTDLKTSLRGVLERLFFVKKTGRQQPTTWPKVVTVHEQLLEFKWKMIDIVGSRKRVHPQTIVDMYTGSKKTIYQNAYNSTINNPVSRRDSYLSTFIKIEKTDFTHKSDPVPRIIQPRNPRYHLTLATYLKPVEHDIYSAIEEMFGNPMIAKGKNAIERGKMLSDVWFEFEEPVAIAADAKRFDQHVSLPMLRWEHSIYKAIFNSKQLSILLHWQCYNRGFCNLEDGVIQYAIQGCRMSGDINTALGNVIIMCAMFWSYLQTKPKSRFINDGDDCVLIVEKRDLDQFDDLKDYFTKLGFTMELDEPVYQLEEIDFCQCRPVEFPTGWRMVRNLEPCLTKDLHTVKSITNEQEFRTQLKSIAACGLSIASDVPIYGAFYSRMFEQNISGSIDKRPEKDGKFWLSQRMPDLGADVSHMARSSFYRAFGIPPNEQIALEAYFKTVEYRYGLVTPHSIIGLD